MPANLSPPGIPPGNIAFPKYEPPPDTCTHRTMMDAREARRRGIREANGWPPPMTEEEHRRIAERDGLMTVAFPDHEPKPPKTTSAGPVDTDQIDCLVRRIAYGDLPGAAGSVRMSGGNKKLVLPHEGRYMALRAYAGMMAARERLTAHLPEAERPAALARMRVERRARKAEFALPANTKRWRRR